MKDKKYTVVFYTQGNTIPEYYIENTLEDANQLIRDLVEETEIEDYWWKAEIVPAHCFN